jgi:uncharacterized protein YndB with AHSA1/START domain/predicted enzyme related to lactoylglutathione lyase
MSKLELKTEADRYLIVTRRFAAPPETVYRAHTEPALVQRWMLGPAGWTMPVCICEAKPGGKIRYEWSDGKGGGFFLTGEFLALEPYKRLLHVERMHMPNATPDNHVETRFEPDGSGTLMVMKMTLPDAKTRGAMLATGMERGMEASYARLEGVLGSGKGQTNGPRPSVHLSIDVPKLDDGVRFYGEVFGFVERSRPFSAMAILDANNVTVCMHEKASGSRSSPASGEKRRYERHWTPVHIDIHVEDFEAVLGKVRAAGGTVEMEFRNQGPMPAGFCADPFGNGFCVIGERKSSESAL